ncbi:hypothetical protein C8R44DRAFT_972663 [Mycena epipterygia]|nr:hypothetical protein C8R44DRAFT_972663 [Mycena epipterygia]
MLRATRLTRYPIVQPRPPSFVPKKSPREDALTEQLWALVENTTLDIFHNPKDPISVRVLAALEAARLQFPKPTPKEGSGVPAFVHARWRGPLKLDIVVHERVPSADEFRLLLPLQAASNVSFSVFIKEQQRMRHSPTGVSSLVALLARDPTLLAWPVIVDWEHDESSVGGTAYSNILKKVLHRRESVRREKKKPEPTPDPPPPTPEAGVPALEEEWRDNDEWAAYENPYENDHFHNSPSLLPTSPILRPAQTLLVLLSLIPNNNIRCAILGLGASVAVLYSVHLRHPSVRLEQNVSHTGSRMLNRYARETGARTMFVERPSIHVCIAFYPTADTRRGLDP